MVQARLGRRVAGRVGILGQHPGHQPRAALVAAAGSQVEGDGLGHDGAGHVDRQRCRGHHFRLGDVADREVHPERPRLGWHGRECASAGSSGSRPAPRHHVDGLRARSSATDTRRTRTTTLAVHQAAARSAGPPNRQSAGCRRKHPATLAGTWWMPSSRSRRIVAGCRRTAGQRGEGRTRPWMFRLAAHCQPYCQPFRVRSGVF